MVRSGDLEDVEVRGTACKLEDGSLDQAHFASADAYSHISCLTPELARCRSGQRPACRKGASAATRSGSRPAPAGWPRPRWPGIPGCIHRSRTASSGRARRPSGRGRSRSSRRRSGALRPAAGCRYRNGGDAAGGGECSNPTAATGAEPGPRPGPARPPCGDTRTAAPSAMRPAAARPPPGPWRPGAGRSWRCGGSGPGSEGPCAARDPDGPAPGPCRVVPTGPSFFSDDLLHPVDDQHLLGDQPLEPGVLGLEVLEPAGIGHVQAAELVAPAEKGLLGQVALLAQGLDRHGADLGFPQDADDLLVGESFLHGALLAC